MHAGVVAKQLTSTQTNTHIHDNKNNNQSSDDSNQQQLRDSNTNHFRSAFPLCLTHDPNVDTKVTSENYTAHKYINIMGQGASTPAAAPAVVHDDKPKKKLGIKTGKPICCCCPDTKKARDECVVFRGEEDPDCKKLIEAHKMCLRDEGFDVK